MDAITVDNLTKVFPGSTKALDRMSFSVSEGEVFGFLGPNGSGKTTTVKLLMGMLLPTEGRSAVFDIDPVSAPDKIHVFTGALTEHAQMYDNLTGMQNLIFYATLFGLDETLGKKRAGTLLERLGLADEVDKKLASYSTGMRQRLSLARALIHEPKLLFLDEPTSGLDPESARSVNELLKSLAENKGATVFLCTHQLRYAQDICTTYGLVDKGHLLAKGDLDYLRSITFPGSKALIKTDTMPEKYQAKPQGDLLYEVQLDNEEAIPSLIRDIVQQGGNIFHVSSEKLSLEEIYFALMQKQEEGESA